MDLREVTTRFQSLCHEGYSDRQLYVDINGTKIPVEDVIFDFKSDVMSNGFIALKLGDIKENACK